MELLVYGVYYPMFIATKKIKMLLLQSFFFCEKSRIMNIRRATGFQFEIKSYTVLIKPIPSVLLFIEITRDSCKDDIRMQYRFLMKRVDRL